MARKQESQSATGTKNIFMSIVMSIVIAFGSLFTLANLAQMAATDYSGDSAGNITGQLIGSGFVVLAIIIVFVILPIRYLYKVWKKN